MATERLKTVKPSGGDYTSLAAAIAGEAGDLVSADEWLHIECYAMNDTAQAIINGYTTSSDCHILIDVPMSERHQGVWDSNKYNLVRNVTEGVIEIRQNHVTLEGLQVRNSQAWASSNGIYAADNLMGIKIHKCIGVSIVRAAFAMLQQTGGTGYEVSNCLAYNCGQRGFAGREGVIFYNCTAVGCAVGFRSSFSNAIFYNCLSALSTTADFDREGSATPFFYNCASSDGTAGAYAGSGNRVNQTFSFVDAANGNFALAENDTGARGHGLTNPGSGLYLDDILGNPRTAPWDIGAFQYVSGEGDEVPTGAINRYYRDLMGGFAR